MRKIVVTEFLSLDGVFEDPRWTFKFDRGEDGDQFKRDEMDEAEALLLGRVTYEGFAQAWPGREDEYGYADKMNSMPKYVVSNSLEDAEWENSTVVGGDIVAELKKLKEEDGGPLIVHGSGQVVRTLVENDLVDEYRFMVFPVVLGGGRRLFPEGLGEARLKLKDSNAVGDSVLTLVYEPDREPLAQGANPYEND